MEKHSPHSVRLEHKAAYWEIYDVVSDAADSVEKALPGGTQARLWRAHDELRAIDAPEDDIRFAESVSVTFHLTNNAIRRAKGRNTMLERILRRRFSTAAREWLNKLPMQLFA